MVLEIADSTVVPGQEDDFLAADVPAAVGH
jgi:hypothetical protein